MPTEIDLFCAITAKNGERVPIQINTESTAADLRRIVSEATSIPLSDLRLIFRGKMIKDDASSSAVEMYKLEKDNVLHCMGKSVATANASGSSGVQEASSAANENTATSSITAAVPSVPVAGRAVASVPNPSASSEVVTIQSALAKLRALNSPQTYVSAVSTLSKVLSNIADHPMEEKYRKVKKANAAFNKKLGGIAGGEDAMKAVGFVIEVQDDVEVYQLHASPEAWPKLMATRATVDEAVAVAKRTATMSAPGPAAPFTANNAAFSNSTGMPGAGPSSSMPTMGAMNNPMMQNAMSEMMRNPEMMRNMLQNPMVQQMIQNDPNIPPAQRGMMQQLASNPAMLDQLSTMMSNPAMMAQLQSAMGANAMGGAAMPAMPNMPAVPGPQLSGQPSQGTRSNNGNTNSGNDNDQTEEEMIAEAIRRSLQDN